MSQYKTCVPSLPYPFFCNFHLAEHGDWLIMVQIYQRPCGVLQTRGRTQLCCLPRDAISNAHSTNTCSMLKTWGKFLTNLPKSTVAPKKEPSQVDAKKFFWEIQKCAQSTARSCSIIWQLFCRKDHYLGQNLLIFLHIVIVVFHA